MKIKDRLMSKIKIINTCWIWTGYANTGGKQYKNEKKQLYGNISYKSYPTAVHRLSYELFIGKIPKGLHIDHICRNTLCINPKHLESVSCRENIIRGHSFSGINSRKKQCKYGHEFNKKNTRILKRIDRKMPYRECIQCSRIKHQKQRFKDGMRRHSKTPIYK